METLDAFDLFEAFDGFDDAAARSFLVEQYGKLVEPHRTRVEELSAKAEEFSALDGLQPVVSQYGPMFQSMGISPSEGFARLAAAQSALANPQTQRRDTLAAFLGGIGQRLPALSDSLAAAYFQVAETPQQLIRLRAPTEP